MNQITTQQFLTAFEEEWLYQIEKNWEQMASDWSAKKRKGEKGTPWTQFMLNKGGFLDSVRARLEKIISPLKYYPEMYQVDAAFVGGVDLYGSNFTNPSALHALIEHELAYDVETETWRLIFWRCPLKILIFYDHAEHEKKSRATREWLENKIPVLRAMISRANADYGDSDNSDYLFIIGSRKSASGKFLWRWTSEKEGQELITFIGE